MAARSTGMFPREGFNLDAECEITTSSAPAAVTLAHAKTIRVIGINVTVDCTVTLGGEAVTLAQTWPAEAQPILEMPVNIVQSTIPLIVLLTSLEIKVLSNPEMKLTNQKVSFT